MMRLCAACRNTSVKRTTGTAPDPMMSASTWPGPTEGSWSISPTISNDARFGNRLEQSVHQQQVAVERMLAVSFEATAFGVHLEQPVDRLGRVPRRLLQPLGGASSRCA